jgi:hypothetical protein
MREYFVFLSICIGSYLCQMLKLIVINQQILLLLIFISPLKEVNINQQRKNREELRYDVKMGYGADDS